MKLETIKVGRIVGAHGIRGEVRVQPRDGRFIEEIGTYNPCVSPAEIKIDTERAQAWIKSGAQPTDTVRALLKKVEVL